MTTGTSKPGYSYSLPYSKTFRAFTLFYNNSNNLMSQNKRRFLQRQVPFRNVDVSTAYAANIDT